MEEHLDLSKLKTISIHEREHIVNVSHFVKPSDPPIDVLAGFPGVLAAADLGILCARIAEAKRKGRTVAIGMGAHVIKCGLSLLFIDLMERGIVHALAMNGASAIHDWEIAFAGATSEKVSQTLADGSFGMVRETPEALNAIAAAAAREGLGFGEALGQEIEASDFPHKDHSLFAAAARLGIPATVHVCMGCDTVHMTADADGAAIGQASMTDFRKITEVVAGLEDGVWLNIGSSVVLPEVFLKAISITRNLTGKPRRFIAADLDMIRHYRPRENVLSRPGGESFALTGHHEIMVPLLRWGVLSELARKK
ncbi:MAG: GSU2086 family protein [Planctomycetota bacterium]|jgi:hypothetical protein